jgi:hypothetical protein
MTVLCSFLLVHVAYTLTRTMRHFNGRTLSVQLPDAVTTAEVRVATHEQTPDETPAYFATHRVF